MTSTPNELTSRLRRRLEAAQREIEETAANELQRLGGNLSAVVDDALRTIEADTGAAVGRLSALLRGWLRPLVIGLIFSLGIIGGSWAGTLAVDDHRAADRGAGGAPRGNRRGPRDAGPDRGDDLGAGADGVAPDPRAGLLEDGGRGGAGRAPRQREAAARSQPRRWSGRVMSVMWRSSGSLGRRVMVTVQRS